MTYHFGHFELTRLVAIEVVNENAPVLEALKQVCKISIFIWVKIR